MDCSGARWHQSDSWLRWYTPAEALHRVHEYEGLNRPERTLRRVRAWLAQ